MIVRERPGELVHRSTIPGTVVAVKVAGTLRRRVG